MLIVDAFGIVNDYVPNISQAIVIKVSTFGQEDNGFGPVP
jgi:hypothetical protein